MRPGLGNVEGEKLSGGHYQEIVMLEQAVKGIGPAGAGNGGIGDVEGRHFHTALDFVNGLRLEQRALGGVVVENAESAALLKLADFDKGLPGVLDAGLGRGGVAAAAQTPKNL